MIAGAQMAKASRIIGVDIDPAKFETGELFGERGGRGRGRGGSQLAARGCGLARRREVSLSAADVLQKRSNGVFFLLRSSLLRSQLWLRSKTYLSGLLM